MKKIIKGKMYDTSTARYLGEATGDEPKNTAHYWVETLYLTKSGNYFIHGYGHARSRYAQKVDYSAWMPGEAIIPFTLDDAKEWGEKYLDGEDYEKIFGIVDENTVKISADISNSAKEKLDSLKDGRLKSNGDVIEYLLGLV